MRTPRFMLGLIIAGTIGGLVVSVYAWPRHQAAVPPPTVTVIVEPGGDTPTATTNPSDEPPAAYLCSAEGREVAGGRGSYCWNSRCLDVFSAVSNAEPFLLVVEQGYSWRFDGPKPASTYETWIPVHESDSSLFANGRSWGGVVPRGSPTPGGAGTYLLVLDAQWSGGRDASYGFYLTVP